MKTKDKNTTEKLPETVEEAYAITGREKIDFSNVPEDNRAFISAVYDMTVVTEALNGDWKADLNDYIQPQWILLFDRTASGRFVFSATTYHVVGKKTDNTFRFCYRSKRVAVHAGYHFIELWNKILAA